MSSAEEASAMAAAATLHGTDIRSVMSSTGPTVRCVLLKHIRTDGKDTMPHPAKAPTSDAATKMAEEVAVSLKAKGGTTSRQDDDDDGNKDDKIMISHKDGDEEKKLPDHQEVESVETKKRDEEISKHSVHNPRGDNQHHHHHRHHHKHHTQRVLTELIEEVKVDTTPSNNGVQKLLGGSFTFLGQYPDEGTVVMARRQFDWPGGDGGGKGDLTKMSVSQLRKMCQDVEVYDRTKMIEKSDLVDALIRHRDELPVNPHRLQPPLDRRVVRGDILIMKVAETDEVLDDENDDADGEEPKEQHNKEEDQNDASEQEKKEDDSEADSDGQDAGEKKKTLEVMSNEEFFQNYTKEEYIAFASRTDIVSQHDEDGDVQAEDGAGDGDGDDEEDDEEERHSEDDEDDDDSDEEFVFGEDDDDDVEGMTSEGGRLVMLNLVMQGVLKKFRAENGRGPDTRELLHLRSEVAQQLGVTVATLDDAEEDGSADGEEDGGGEDDDEDEDDDKKRKAQSDATTEGGPATAHCPKKVKFSEPDDTAAAKEGVAAEESCNDGVEKQNNEGDKNEC